MIHELTSKFETIFTRLKDSIDIKKHSRKMKSFEKQHTNNILKLNKQLETMSDSDPESNYCFWLHENGQICKYGCTPYFNCSRCLHYVSKFYAESTIRDIVS